MRYVMAAIVCLSAGVAWAQVDPEQDAIPVCTVYGLTRGCVAQDVNARAYVRDAASASDCTTGGGTTLNGCRFNGLAWVNDADMDGGGSSSSVSVNGTSVTDPDFRSEGNVDFTRCTDAGAPDARCLADGDVIADGGDVTGPVSSTHNAVTRFDATTGKVIKNSGCTISDTGVLTCPEIVVNGSGTAGIVLEDEATLTNPTAGSTTIGTVGGRLFYRDTDLTQQPAHPLISECADLREDFWGWTAETGSPYRLFADTFWVQSIENGGSAATTGISNSTGQITMRSNTTANGAIAIYKAHAATTHRLMLQNRDVVEWRLRVVSLGNGASDNVRVVAGLCSTVTTPYECNDGAGFYYDSADDTTWHTFTAQDATWPATNMEDQDTGVTVSASEFVNLRMECVGSTCSSLNFYINGTLETTHTTYIPTSSSSSLTASPMVGVTNLGATTDRQVYFDAFGWRKCYR